jgi:hypothetical protein
MGAEDCIGEGSGWGTIAGVRLKILVLAGEDRLDADRLARALARHHEVESLNEGGILAALTAARAARSLAPDLVHAVGVEGAAKAAHAVAAGIGAPLVVSLAARDFAKRTRARALERAQDAAALLCDEGATADLLRAEGISRDVYVVALPGGADETEDRLVLEAIEVVYGRVIAELRPEIAARARSLRDGEEPKLVKIGGTRGKGEA